MKKKVVVAMSGGVDSSVAAAVLANNDYEVLGLFMNNGITVENNNRRSCCSLQDAQDARNVAYQLGIKFYSLDFSKEFSKLIDYFLSEYLKGRTPSPCIKCNSYLKFGVLLKFAQLVGADYVATGHYAQIIKNNNRFQILESVDKNKDQSYFLFELSQEQLSRALLPLGGLTKQEVRTIASQLSLKTAFKKESQDLCFIPDGNIRKFLESKIQNTPTRGLFLDSQGRKIGEHSGYIYYTIGQRRGLGISKGIPLYVKEIDPATKNVVLATKDELLYKKALVSNVKWVSIDAPSPGTLMRAEVKIRYKSPKSPAILTILKENSVEIEFDEKQPAVTPGQAACFYENNVLLGGGWIDKAIIC
ncbi:MAG: tRNA 2-thiouridine(34) synthase MnmA [Planctomycetota bacterium]